MVTMRITLCAMVLSVLLLPSVLGAQAPATVAGRWEGEIGEKGKTEHIVMVMAVEGDRLSGSILLPTAELDMGNGSVKGRAVQFATVRRLGGEVYTFDWTGTVTGDVIAFTYVDEYRQFPMVKFTVKRQK